MSMARCNRCSDLIDTDECPECYRGKNGDTLLCDACAKDAWICEACGEVCDTEEASEVEVSEAWGAREVQTVYHLISNCCGADVCRIGEE